MHATGIAHGSGEDDDNFSLGSAPSYLYELIGELDNEDSEDSDNESREEDSDNESREEDSDDEDLEEIESESETIVDEEYGPEDGSCCDTVLTSYDSDSDYSSDDEYELGETRIVFNHGCNLLI